MNLLAIDASGVAGSVAYIKGGKLAGEYYICDKLTHSQTIMPMLEHMKSLIQMDLNEIDAVAVTSGPGSFTGLRIGVTAAKALALSLEVPIIGVPTLDVIAHSMCFTDYYICPIMDARRNQVYTAVYKWRENTLERLTDYLATDINEHLEQLKAYDSKVIFLGDGVSVYKEMIKETLNSQAIFAPNFCMMQQASVLGSVAEKLYEEGKGEDPSTFVPMYLRKSQAEREKEEREKNAH
ncbi:MAG: tRNA (adenosine(37)-N6)-threonylcarbamoyltransferase complex dimerization subunit type 1 TsaB [Cellulosilyticum sp.]|nr:tRNA (adenosine(37)-N6)-threonylcarbamoyltransferase complex dimerization subunit type 1 TsaB [Cellulosilyticum sp.]